VNEPNEGWTAFFVELVYESSFQGPDEFDFHFTTEMRVLPDVLPFEADLNRDRITDILDMGIFGDVWLSGNVYRDIWPRRGGNGVVDFMDFALSGMHWLEGR